MMSNKKTSSPQCEEEGPAREIYPGIAYFIMYRPSEACNESKIFSILHNADMEPTVTKLRTRNSASRLFHVLKDHANEAVQNLVRESNTFCFRRAITDMREQDLPAPEEPRSYPTKACRIVIVNVTEHQTHMTEAHRNLESDGLVAKIISLLNVTDTTRETNVSDLTQTIKDIDRVMQLCDHALFSGKNLHQTRSSQYDICHDDGGEQLFAPLALKRQPSRESFETFCDVVEDTCSSGLYNY